MLIDKIKNYKLLQKLQKKFTANLAYQGIGTYQDVLDDQGYIKSTKSLPKHADGKLPGYEDGKRYLWDDQTQSWDRITDSDVANAMAEWAFTPTTTRAKFDYENTPNPVKPLQKNAVISQDNNAWTKQRVAEESNKRTWLSDAADAMRYVQYGADAASILYTPGLIPAIKNRAAKAIYRNIAPASYKESYLKGGKRAEVINTFLDFVSPRPLTLTNNAYSKWMKEYALKDFETITPATSARDEIYRRYLGLPSSNLYYSPTQQTGVFTHNLYNTHYKDVLKQINHAATKDPELSGKITTGIDYMNSAGGNISQKIKMLDSNNAVL
jgi:hypothetical protein